MPGNMLCERSNFDHDIQIYWVLRAHTGQVSGVPHTFISGWTPMSLVH